MDQTFQGFDKATVFSIAGTLGLLVFGTLIYFSSFEKLTADGKGKKHGEGKRDIAYKPASSSVSTGDGRKDVASPNGDTIKSSSALIEATRDSSSKMKGYKITSDGRKTTYFNREMTEAEKILLGDSTPKQLMNNIPSSDGACFQSLSAKSASSVGSAWNTAGTWEERNHSPWASKRIKQLLTAASMDIVNKNASGTVRKQ